MSYRICKKYPLNYICFTLDLLNIIQIHCELFFIAIYIYVYRSIYIYVYQGTYICIHDNVTYEYFRVLDYL